MEAAEEPAGEGGEGLEHPSDPWSEAPLDTEPAAGELWEGSRAVGEMTPEAAETSWLKFFGPLVVAIHVCSYLVDHCRRCW